jgi:hypothetical protein
MVSKQTTLDLNGPILSFIQQPQSIIVDNNSTVTFTGIATATFPTQTPPNSATNTGTLSYRWYADGFGPLNDGPFRGATLAGTGTTILTVSNAKSPDTNSTNFFLGVDYIPSAYSQPIGSSVTVGTAKSTGNALNEILGSNSATLTVRPFITITSQPIDTTAASGRQALFDVDATLSDDRFGSLSYQWQLDNQNLSDDSLVQGSREKRLTLTSSPPLIEPILSAPVCISVIDESSPTATTIRNDWLSFRSNHPNRDFWLLQPGRTNPELKIPAEYEADSKANYSQVARDSGNTSLRSDWFVICNLGSYPAGTVISLAIDGSGSMTLSTVRASYDLFKQKCAEAGLVLVETTFGDERWAPPHNKDLPNAESSSTCISVIDESSPTATTIRNDWLSFRSNHPNRDFWLLQPGRTKTELKIPAEYEADSKANYSQVARDNGNVSSRSDWFVICNLGSLKPGSVVSLAIDGSGSMTLSTVRASYDLFKQKCAEAGLVLVETTFGDERWAPPHNKALPEPESTTVGSYSVNAIVSNPSAQSVISNIVNFTVISPRPIINIEDFVVGGSNFFRTTNLVNGPHIAFGNVNPGTIYVVYAPERNIRVRITLAAGAGESRNGFFGGEGGVSVFNYTFEQNVEYAFKMGSGVIGGPRGGANNRFGGGVTQLYRKAKLVAMCGGGGAAGTAARGGAGGGVNLAGQSGLGRGAGGGGRTVSPGTTLNGSFASGTTGGFVSTCMRGDELITITGIPACNDFPGLTQSRLPDGSVVSNSEFLFRGFKPGQPAGFRTNGGNGSGNQGGGGSGAYGGNASISNGSGGGGGSGYSDGSIGLISSTVGGNTSTSGSIRIELA